MIRSTYKAFSKFLGDVKCTLRIDAPLTLRVDASAPHLSIIIVNFTSFCKEAIAVLVPERVHTLTRSTVFETAQCTMTFFTNRFADQVGFLSICHP